MKGEPPRRGEPRLSSTNPAIPAGAQGYAEKIRITPILSLLAAGLVVFLTITASGLTEPRVLLNGQAVRAWISYFALFAFGAVVGVNFARQRSERRSRTQRPAGELDARGLLSSLLLITSVGVALRLVDRLILRPELLFTNIDTIQSETTIPGAVASLLYPLAIAALPVAYMQWETLNLRVKSLTLAYFFFPAIDVLLVGKRGALISIAFLFIFYQVTFRRLRLGPKGVLTGLLALSLVGYLSYSIFLERIDAYGFGPCHSLYNSTYAHTLTPSELAGQACSRPGQPDHILVALTNFSMYYTHGFWEFSIAYDYQTSQGLSWGGNTFQTLLKPLCLTGVFDCTAPDSFRSGIYTTLWGPLRGDYGFVLYLVAPALGVGLGALQFAARATVRWLPLYAFLSTVIFFAPSVNLIQSGLGVYFLTATLLFLLLERLHRRAP